MFLLASCIPDRLHLTILRDPFSIVPADQLEMVWGASQIECSQWHPDSHSSKLDLYSRLPVKATQRSGVYYRIVFRASCFYLDSRVPKPIMRIEPTMESDLLANGLGECRADSLPLLMVDSAEEV